MKAIIHIGLPKTGSSSIQHYLYTQRTFLNQHNHHYPESAMHGCQSSLLKETILPPRVPSTLRKQRKLIGNKQGQQQLVTHFTNAFEQEIKQHNENTTFIFSDEGLSIRLINKKRIQALKMFLQKYFSDITIIAYVRRQDDWLRSDLTQALRMQKNRFFQYSYFYRLKSLLKYDKIYRLWCQQFGKHNVTFRPFAPECFNQHSLISDFCNQTGIPHNQEHKETKENLSVNCQGQSYLFCINALHKIKIITQEERQKYVDYINDNFFGKGYTPTAKQQQRISHYFRKHNAFLDCNQLNIPTTSDHANTNLTKKTIRKLKNKNYQLQQYLELKKIFNHTDNS